MKPTIDDVKREINTVFPGVKLIKKRNNHRQEMEILEHETDEMVITICIRDTEITEFRPNGWYISFRHRSKREVSGGGFGSNTVAELINKLRRNKYNEFFEKSNVSQISLF